MMRKKTYPKDDGFLHWFDGHVVHPSRERNVEKPDEFNKKLTEKFMREYNGEWSSK